MGKTILHKRSSRVLTDGSPHLPDAASLDYGEIAINFAAGVESLSIKNSDNEIVRMKLNSTSYDNAITSLESHIADTENPHGVTKAQVGLGNVDNTADADKPISTLQQTALDSKLGNADNGGIADNLTTNSTTVALSAAQGIVLNQKISEMTSGAISDLQALEARVAAVEEEIQTATTYIDDTLMPAAIDLSDNYTL